ncbi:hypothetical protein AWB79_00831 [Caballeronia hypogeia]|uniref:Glycerophosphoryl diester phosphodiesterase membrane domain-containing protein n=1 Tax=Caballeronia hypogeia TaxID=1777140 RepID=A0A157ZG28_9BURK|nr:hypothetical protein [Caballeronia hypogeia]SAK44484.1 hypothetical protein AWB79_00831 [Caballeronia hypogeia]
MQEMTFGACVKDSWKGTFRFISQIPGLFWGSIALSMLLYLLAGPNGGESDVRGRFIGSMVQLALLLVVVPVLQIKVCRFLALGERARPLMPDSGACYGRFIALALIYTLFAGLAIALFVIATILASSPGDLRTMMSHRFIIGAFAFSFVCASCFIVIRLSLLHAGIALSQKLEFRAAWRDSRGHFWSMFAVMFATFLALFALTYISAFLAIFAGVMLGDKSAFLSIVNGFFLPLAAVQGASTATILYRRYANELAAKGSAHV